MLNISIIIENFSETNISAMTKFSFKTSQKFGLVFAPPESHIKCVLLPSYAMKTRASFSLSCLNEIYTRRASKVFY